MQNHGDFLNKLLDDFLLWIAIKQPAEFLVYMPEGTLFV